MKGLYIGDAMFYKHFTHDLYYQGKQVTSGSSYWTLTSGDSRCNVHYFEVRARDIPADVEEIDLNLKMTKPGLTSA